MGMKPSWARSVVAASLAALVAAGFPPLAHAGMVSTQQAIEAEGQAQRAADLGKVEALLARADVQARLVSLGVDPADAAARAAALPSADLARLANGIDRLPAGGDGGLLALIGFVFVVLLILDYLDVVHVFSHHNHR